MRLIAQIKGARVDEKLLTQSQTEDYLLSKAKLEKYGVSLLTVVEQWIANHERAKSLVHRSVPDLVEEFLAEKKLEGAGSLHLADRRSRMRMFAKVFVGRIDRITTAEVKLWLRGNGGSRRTQRNHRNAFLQLFRFARAKGCLPKNEPTAVDEVAVAGGDEGGICIYSVPEMRELLAHAPPRLMPFFCLGAFAGLRSQEIMRLEWRDVKFGQHFIEVTAAKSKTASRRLVPLLPVLKKWLFPFRASSGRVVEYFHNAGLIRARSAFCRSGIKTNGKAVPFQWKPNASRHSYASYRIADIKDAARVALEMGNSRRCFFELIGNS